MTDADGHNELVRQEFTKQAEAYAATPAISDSGRIARLVEMTAVRPGDRVLDMATGPGYVAMAFSPLCAEVVGVDITLAPLAIAERTRQARGLSNVRFELADVNDLPFPDATFDAVVCRFAFHHFVDPAKALGQMVRVCRGRGAVVVEDLIVSEDPARAAYRNAFERLRDASHTTAMPLSTLLRLFGEHGLEVDGLETGALTPQVERWLANAQTPAARAAEAREMIARDERFDLSGARPFRDEAGQLHFTQRTAIVRGYKLDKAGDPGTHAPPA